MKIKDITFLILLSISHNRLFASYTVCSEIDNIGNLSVGVALHDFADNIFITPNFDPESECSVSESDWLGDITYYIKSDKTNITIDSIDTNYISNDNTYKHTVNIEGTNSIRLKSHVVKDKNTNLIYEKSFLNIAEKANLNVLDNLGVNTVNVFGDLIIGTQTLSSATLEVNDYNIGSRGRLTFQNISYTNNIINLTVQEGGHITYGYLDFIPIRTVFFSYEFSEEKSDLTVLSPRLTIDNAKINNLDLQADTLMIQHEFYGNNISAQDKDITFLNVPTFRIDGEAVVGRLLDTHNTNFLLGENAKLNVESDLTIKNITGDMYSVLNVGENKLVIGYELAEGNVHTINAKTLELNPNYTLNIHDDLTLVDLYAESSTLIFSQNNNLSIQEGSSTSSIKSLFLPGTLILGKEVVFSLKNGGNSEIFNILSEDNATLNITQKSNLDLTKDSTIGTINVIEDSTLLFSGNNLFINTLNSDNSEVILNGNQMNISGTLTLSNYSTMTINGKGELDNVVIQDYSELVTISNTDKVTLESLEASQNSNIVINSPLYSDSFSLSGGSELNIDSNGILEVGSFIVNNNYVINVEGTLSYESGNFNISNLSPSGVISFTGNQEEESTLNIKNTDKTTGSVDVVNGGNLTIIDSNLLDLNANNPDYLARLSMNSSRDKSFTIGNINSFYGTFVKIGAGSLTVEESNFSLGSTILVQEGELVMDNISDTVNVIIRTDSTLTTGKINNKNIFISDRGSLFYENFDKSNLSSISINSTNQNATGELSMLGRGSLEISNSKIDTINMESDGSLIIQDNNGRNGNTLINNLNISNGNVSIHSGDIRNVNYTKGDISFIGGNILNSSSLFNSSMIIGNESNTDPVTIRLGSITDNGYSITNFEGFHQKNFTFDSLGGTLIFEYDKNYIIGDINKGNAISSILEIIAVNSILDTGDVDIGELNIIDGNLLSKSLTVSDHVRLTINKDNLSSSLEDSTNNGFIVTSLSDVSLSGKLTLDFTDTSDIDLYNTSNVNLFESLESQINIDDIEGYLIDSLNTDLFSMDFGITDEGFVAQVAIDRFSSYYDAILPYDVSDINLQIAKYLDSFTSPNTSSIEENDNLTSLITALDTNTGNVEELIGALDTIPAVSSATYGNSIHTSGVTVLNTISKEFYNIREDSNIHYVWNNTGFSIANADSSGDTIGYNDSSLSTQLGYSNKYYDNIILAFGLGYHLGSLTSKHEDSFDSDYQGGNFSFGLDYNFRPNFYLSSFLIYSYTVFDTERNLFFLDEVDKVDPISSHLNGHEVLGKVLLAYDSNISRFDVDVTYNTFYSFGNLLLGDYVEQGTHSFSVEKTNAFANDIGFSVDFNKKYNFIGDINTTLVPHLGLSTFFRNYSNLDTKFSFTFDPNSSFTMKEWNNNSIYMNITLGANYIVEQFNISAGYKFENNLMGDNINNMGIFLDISYIF